MCCRNVAAETDSDTSRMLSTPILFIYRFVSDIHGIISILTNLTVPLVQKKNKKKYKPFLHFGVK
jgi:hypothetical protein